MGVQRKLMQVENDKIYNDKQLNDLNIENSSLKNLLSTERRRYNEMEIILSQERETMLQRQMQQENLISENASLRSELTRLNARISGMNVQFESLVSKEKLEGGISENVEGLHNLIHEKDQEISNLLSEQTKTRDEYNKLKFANFRLESDLKECQNRLEHHTSGSIHLHDLQSGSHVNISKTPENINLRDQIRNIREEYDNIMGKYSDDK